MTINNSPSCNYLKLSLCLQKFPKTNRLVLALMKNQTEAMPHVPP